MITLLVLYYVFVLVCVIGGFIRDERAYWNSDNAHAVFIRERNRERRAPRKADRERVCQNARELSGWPLRWLRSQFVRLPPKPPAETVTSLLDKLGPDRWD